MNGKKFDSVDKVQWRHIPWREVEEAAKVMNYGAVKYQENPDSPNWPRVENGYHRYFDALMRHLTAERRGEYYDPESGLPHMSHVIFNALALSHFARIKHEENNTEIHKEETVGNNNRGTTYTIQRESMSTSGEPFKVQYD